MSSEMWIFDVTNKGNRAYKAEDYRKKIWLTNAVDRTDDERMKQILFNELEQIELRASSYYQDNVYGNMDK